MRRSDVYGLLLPTVLMFASCDGNPAAPIPCALEPAMAFSALEGVSQADVSFALLDAAERSTQVLTNREEAPRLRAALMDASSAGPQAAEARCNALKSARSLLLRQPDDPAAAPDLASIRMSLDIAQTYFAPRQ